jgi:hypothetical protein
LYRTRMITSQVRKWLVIICMLTLLSKLTLLYVEEVTSFIVKLSPRIACIFLFAKIIIGARLALPYTERPKKK